MLSKLALYAGASGDHNPVHIDLDFAKRAGFPDVFAHGMFVFGKAAQLVTSMTDLGRLREFGAKFVAMTHVQDVLTCRATIIERFEQDGETRLRLAISLSTADGRETLSGDAVVAIDEGA